MSRAPQTDSKGLKLSDFLCFSVYSANLAFGRVYKSILEPLGLTYTQYIALVALCEGDDQTVGDLGEKLFLESNTLTPILKKLEGMGYIHRRRDPADERQVRGGADAGGAQTARRGSRIEAVRSHRPRRRFHDCAADREPSARQSPPCDEIRSGQIVVRSG